MSENSKSNQITISEKFADTVIKNLNELTHGIQVTTEQKNLIAGYFLAIDTTLKEHPDNLTWKDVNLQKLAPSLANKAALGLDMNIKNTLFAIPYKNKSTGLVIVDLQVGYEGEKYLAMKFSKRNIKDICIELVHENDTFQVIKKDAQRPYDNYIFEINNPFDRGDIIGAFGYVSYDDPQYNKIVTLSKVEIIKRKACSKSEKFWGKWYDQMCKKTMIKETCRQIEVDAEKIKEYKYLLDFKEKEEVEQCQEAANNEIQQNIETQEIIDIDVEDEIP
ncbi:MAG: recombinase RecT [Mycoplasmoidaceae bacterium]|nr:recombinase RecT [Mycoplasmoidaceae bacterium]